ncbi:hypothetical protein G9A89_001477 [Geosiphon pyriformis]|nr:hypothetical protein G9A89_001477 [Geosiphon pyriformis]
MYALTKRSLTLFILVICLVIFFTQAAPVSETKGTPKKQLKHNLKTKKLSESDEFVAAKTSVGIGPIDVSETLGVDSDSTRDKTAMCSWGYWRGGCGLMK